MELIQFNNFNPEYSPNLLGVPSLLNGTVSISASGSGSVNVDNNFGYSKNAKSAYLNSPYDLGVGIGSYFNSGTALSTIISKDGVHIFQFSILNNTNYVGVLNADLTLEVWIDGILTHEFVKSMDLMELQNQIFYNFTQSFEALEGQEVNYSFRVDSPYQGFPSPILKLYFSGFKLEVDDRKLNMPTIYDEPITIIEQTLNVDFGSIASNGFAIIESDVIGVVEFDKVSVSTSFVASNSGLVFQAYASNTDKVTVISRNVTGLAIDLGATDFKIKIIK